MIKKLQNVLILIMLLTSCDKIVYNKTGIKPTPTHVIVGKGLISGLGHNLTLPTPIPTKISSPIGSVILWPSCYNSIGQRYGTWWNGEQEQGTDFNCAFHTQILALWEGTIIEAQRTCWNSTCTSSSGGVIIINARVPNLGMESTYYLHIDEIQSNIRIGNRVQKGQLLGLSGGQLGYGFMPVSPGFSSGPHIEMGFDAYFLCYQIICQGIHTNPLPYIQETMR